MSKSNSYKFQTPEGYRRAYTVTGSLGVARLLHRIKDGIVFAQITFWPKAGQKAKHINVSMNEVNYARLNITPKADGSHDQIAALSKVVNLPGGIPLLPREERQTVSQYALGTASSQSEVGEYNEADNCAPATS